MASQPVVSEATQAASDPAGDHYQGRRRAASDEAPASRAAAPTRSEAAAGTTRQPSEEADAKPPLVKDPMALLHTGVRGLGELLITFGLVVLLFAAYEVWGKSAQVDAAQNEMESRLENEWQGDGGQAKPPKEKPLPGKAIARLYIPRLDRHWVVVEGVNPGDIKNGPGHYPETAMPGRIGNFSAAGHRMPAVFWNLHKMEPGDKIFVEDRQNWYEYQVTETRIVKPNQVEVVAPVPGRPGAKPTKAMLTLTTCNPQWDNYERLIVHAELAGTRPKSQGRPPEIAEKD